MGNMQQMFTSPVGRILSLVTWSVIFALLLGAINGWYLQKEDAGVSNSERYDRVVIAGTNEVADAWGDVTSVSDAVSINATGGGTDTATAYKVAADGTGCKIGEVGTDLTAPYGAATFYTPLGSEVTTVPLTVAGGDAGTAIKISGCRYEPGGEIFNAGGLSSVIGVLLQAAGLAPPIALLFELGKFGTSFVGGMTDNPILSAVLTGILLLLVATLLNTFIPFLGQAFTSVDANRFVMFDEGIGALAIVVKRFWAVVLVASLAGLAWQVIKAMKGGGNAMTQRPM